MELKNDIQVRGTLKSVDQYLNIKLDDISVVNEISYPHLVSNVMIFSLYPATLRVALLRDVGFWSVERHEMLRRGGIQDRIC